VSQRPVVCFFPARNEAATVASVVRRVPAAVAGHPVITIVVDDGSIDDTGALAATAGARVVSLDPGHGLGAAVRRGLAEAVALDAVAVAFCDADGEYAPEELERLVAPILVGRADYVVGSRFVPRRQPMRVHRRAGNRVLTAAMRALTTLPITDGQSGYRALSGAAAAHAEIAHDYNYAQVLTLDLVGKGFRYEEVPISYSPREHGRSFVRLVPYLCHVVPTALRVRVRARGRRGTPAPALVLHDVLPEPVARV
jgi:glycosyltransferase involved in cell wall biosynthesis